MITDKSLIENWNKFRDIPINNDDTIDEDFWLWKKGTDRFEIWHFFDEEFSEGLVELNKLAFKNL